MLYRRVRTGDGQCHPARHVGFVGQSFIGNGRLVIGSEPMIQIGQTAHRRKLHQLKINFFAFARE